MYTNICIDFINMNKYSNIQGILTKYVMKNDLLLYGYIFYFIKYCGELVVNKDFEKNKLI